MISFRTLFTVFFAMGFHFFYAQYNGLGFIYPIDKTPVITGNYGEIRPNHFHAGLDFSTDPVANLPIKSVADGYVSRIKISSGGYGRVLYITHTNGYVTVYAHQKKYAEKIDAYVRKKQIEQKKNEPELFPTPSEIPVKQGEVIGYSGNSGSSTGPHLHFEIREEKSEIPVNPLLTYDVKDDVKPELTHLAIYNTADTNRIVRALTLPVKNIKGKLSLPKYTQLLNENTFALGFSGFDKASGNNNKNNIYEAKVMLDDQLIYHHQLNYISFDNGRYVNTFSEKEEGVKFQKCFTPQCYDVPIYKTVVNGGKIVLNDTLPHKINVIVSDEKGNKNTLTFFVKTKQLKGYMPSSIKYNVLCGKEFKLKENNIELIIPPGSLSNNLYLHKRIYIKEPVGEGITYGDKNDVVLKPFKVAIKVSTPLKGKESKLVMTVNGNILGGSFDEGWLRAESKALGTFNYTYDTIAPTINFPLSKKTKVLPATHIRFKISDHASGIADYHVYVNDVWQIAEYDAKTSTVSCYFNEPLASGIVKIEVTDKVGNKTVVTRSIE